MLLKVLEKEEIGIPVSTELLDELDTPIVDEKDIPSMFIPKPFPIVECYNYPDSDEMLDFDANQNIMDPNMVEYYSQGELLTQPEDDELFSHVYDNVLESNIDNIHDSAYHRMLPSFKDVVRMVTSEDDIQEFHQTISKLIGSWKSKHAKATINPNYTYISSNVNCETATNHHGCDGYKRRKRT